MTIYASWRNEDIAGIIPNLREVLADPERIDFQQLKLKLDEYLGAQLTHVEALLSGEELQQFQADHNPQALTVVMGKIENVMVELKRIMLFSQTVEDHYAEHVNELRAPILGMVGKIQGIVGFMNQTLSGVIEQVSQMDDTQLNELFAQSDALRKYEPLIRKAKITPKPDLERIALLNMDEFVASLNKLKESFGADISEEEKKKVFADALSTIIRLKDEQAQAVGFADTLSQFAYQNNAPKDLIDNLAEAANSKMQEMGDDFAALSKLANGRKGREYSWDEAKEITCAAFDGLDPKLGDIARKAFDEGWILAKDKGIDNPKTFGGLPVSQDAQGHPFAAIPFHGNTMDVIFVGHEMAHVISNFIAGQNQGVLTHGAPMIVQESFSHFAEALMEKEMLKRAKDEEEKLHIKTTCLVKEFDALTIVPFAKFEEELYELVRKKGKENPTFDEINDLYRKNYDLLEKLTGESADIREMQALWNVINQPPHNLVVYPITNVMAAGLLHEFERAPDEYRRNYQDVMEAGGRIGVTELWDSLLGDTMQDKKVFLTDRVKEVAQKLKSLRQEYEALPTIANSDKENVIQGIVEDAPNKIGGLGDTAIGKAIGAFTQRESTRKDASNRSVDLRTKNWSESSTRTNHKFAIGDI